MKIIHIAAECAPLAKVGGLGDVVGALTDGLAAVGHSVELFLPDYPALDRRTVERREPGSAQQLKIGWRTFDYSIGVAWQASSDVSLRLVSCPELFDLEGIYAGDAEQPWRYALLTLAALRTADQRDRPTDVVHCHDWHAALAAAEVKRTRHAGGLAAAKTVLTLHNLAYQGVFAAEIADAMGLAGLVSEGRPNLLESGVRAADMVTTVSPGYAAEIVTPEHGMGLDALLASRGDRLVGVLNGVDEREWSPVQDERLPATYSVDDLAGKRRNREELVRRTGLAADEHTPVLATVSRLVEQKGCDLYREGFGELLERLDARFVVLGTGERRYEELFESLRAQQPQRVAFFREFNTDLAHLIEAGSDIFLMPSRFEPCGLNQMYSMLYGTPPVVHRTGGLGDTVEPFDRLTGEGSGFVFDEYSRKAFSAAIEAAVGLYREPAHWERLMRNGMNKDFSWDRAVGSYEGIYRNLISAPARV